MKKLTGLLLIVIMGFTACEGPMGPEGPMGRDGRDGKNGINGMDAISTEWWNIEYEIKQSDWVLVGLPGAVGSYYKCIFDVDELTEDIYYDGAIISYYQFVDDAGDWVQTALPYTYYGRDNPQGDFSVQYSYDVTVKSIAFKVAYSDFQTQLPPPESCIFKLTLLY